MIDRYKYDPFIKKIKRKKNIISALAVIAMVAVFFYCSGFYAYFGDSDAVDYKGHSLLTLILLIVAVLFVTLIALIIVFLPLTKSLFKECDPEKYIVLNTEFSKGKTLDEVYANGFFYLGNFDVSIGYSEKLLSSSNATVITNALFNKARCELFKNDIEAMLITVDMLKSYISVSKINGAAKVLLNKMLKAVDLMVAIADNSKESIPENITIDSWDTSKATLGFLSYLTALARDCVGDKESAEYFYTLVKESYPNLFFAKLAEDALENIHNKN